LSQYPPSGVGTIETMLETVTLYPGSEPWEVASPKT
jgi:hypothetical protein